MKRIVAFLLVLCMVLSMTACGAPAEQIQQQTPDNLELQVENTGEMDREDKELVAELIGGQDASTMTDTELDDLVNQLIGEPETESGVVNLGHKQEAPKVDFTPDPDVYDEDGAMTEPFDQVYPELIEKEQVAFSGESILIKLKSNKLTDGLKAAGVGALEVIVPMEGASWYEAKLTEGTDPKEAISAVRQLEEVLLAEYNYEVQVAALDDYKHFDKDKDEEFKKNGHNKDQWHFHHCGIPDGYDKMETEGGDKSVIVAVIDSGVDYTHEDLKDNMWVNKKEIPDNNMDDDGNGYIDDYYGVDIITGKGSGNDTNGHGTHVAGIVAARNNNVGTLGIAYNTRIMSVKAANHSGFLNQADIAKAVLYAYNHGAEVINMSFGGTACSIAVQDALATAYTRCVLVASAGNNGAKNEGIGAIPNYPACLTYVLGVMSVDEYGHRSLFSNYDSTPYNGVEYEVYAPGENIMSTLPGNQYGYLSGTSMAAPIVSSFAAILRSEFSDRDMYPTKFIYGQLAATSDYYGDDRAHQIVNLHAALTKMPKPDVSYKDYRLFDDPKYSDKNNGDGVIDAGETIALGFILHNRWGMSKNTLVTIDTKSPNTGLDDPYITIQNPTVDYGSIGTYSDGDCGRVWTDELWTGWEDPFLITISEDCPNDYWFSLNISIACENALDAEDTAVYTNTATVTEAVRAGYVLPGVIDEDMVLTKDNLYIIPNGTMIKEGVTVRVMPGTHIQFWTDDPDDTYAATYVAYLLVNGKLLVEGTREEPVMIYPSQLMEKYNVEIAEGKTGYVSMKYADITNFAYLSNPNTDRYNRISLAECCTFRMAHGDLKGRYVSGGRVYERSFPGSGAYLGEVNAVDCVFYKLAGFYFDGYSLNTQQFTFENVTARRCIFVECGINYQEGSYTDCVFLKNNYVNQMYPDVTVNSSMLYAPQALAALVQQNRNQFEFVYNPESDSTFIRYFGSSSIEETDMAEILACVGGDFAIFETQAEYDALIEKDLLGSRYFHMGIRYDDLKGCYTWHDGSAIGSFIDQTRTPAYSDYAYLEGYKLQALDGSHYTSFLFEVPGNPFLSLPEVIELPAYALALDMESTYQLQPISKPVRLDNSDFLYATTDPSVVTVSKTGLVTPVGYGVADVYVHSADKAVSNHMTVEVKPTRPAEAIYFPTSTLQLFVGNTVTCGCKLLPGNATYQPLRYETSDPAVATVDAYGNVTGVGNGTAVITASLEGLEDATLTVQVSTRLQQLAFAKKSVSYNLKSGIVELPKLRYTEGAAPVLRYRVADAAVATVEGDQLILHTEGTTTLQVIDEISGMTAEISLLIYDGIPFAVKDVQVTGDMYWVLAESGELYAWRYGEAPRMVQDGVVLFDACANRPTSNNISDSANAVLVDGSIVRVWNDQIPGSVGQPLENVPIRDIEFRTGYYEGTYSYTVYDNGYCYAEGANNEGQLGIGSSNYASEPTLIQLENVVQVESHSGYTYFLTEEGSLYYSGYGQLSPALLAQNVTWLYQPSGYGEVQFRNPDGWFTLENYSSAPRINTVPADSSTTHYSSYYTVEDGVLFRYSSRLSDKLDIALFAAGDAALVITEDQQILTTNGSTLTPVDLKQSERTPLQLEGTNLVDGVLLENALILDFNKKMNGLSPRLYANGTEIVVSNTVLDCDRVILNLSRGFRKGTTYRLVVEASGMTVDAVVSEGIDLTFTCDVKFQADNDLYVTFDGAGTVAQLPELNVADLSKLDITWTSADPAVADVVDGQLVLYASGATSLRMEDAVTGSVDTIDLKVYLLDEPVETLPALPSKQALLKGTNLAARSYNQAGTELAGQTEEDHVKLFFNGIVRSLEIQPVVSEQAAPAYTVDFDTAYIPVADWGYGFKIPAGGVVLEDGSTNVYDIIVRPEAVSSFRPVTTLRVSELNTQQEIPLFMDLQMTSGYQDLLNIRFRTADDTVAYVEDGKLVIVGYGKTVLYGSWNGLTARTALEITAGEEEAEYNPLTVQNTNVAANGILWDAELQLVTNLDMPDLTLTLEKVAADGQVTLKHTVASDLDALRIAPVDGYESGAEYVLTITHGETTCQVSFMYYAEGLDVEMVEPRMSVLDASVARHTAIDILIQKYEKHLNATQVNAHFVGNAILNPISTDDVVENWLRLQAPSVYGGEYKEVPVGGNFWGSTNTRAIELQMIDYTDFANYARLVYSPYLETAPENTFPFVTSVKLLNKYGEEVKTVGNETVTFRVTFNRDMDTSIPLQFRFGSTYPYGDYEVEGQYVDARTWEGTYTLKTIIENGNQFITIENGRSATEDLDLYLDRGRFGFVIDTTAAQALIMQGTAMDTGIELRWSQDDFDTLMGYNVYRSTAEDGLYTRVNNITIPADTMTFFDDTVEPGKVYYYNFTVVQTDLTESEPSGKIVIMSKDTMAPNIYHSPVANAFAGDNLVLGATVTDNLNIAYANLYYRVTGTESWSIVRMNKLNDQYTAIIPATYMTVAGLEYYIEAFDGVSFTYKGSADAPYTILVQETVDANALGDVDGDGVITNLDALKLLYAINDKYNMSAEEFARADLNGDGVLWAAEALRILQYVSGAVGSVKM